MAVLFRFLGRLRPLVRFLSQIRARLSNTFDFPCANDLWMFGFVHDHFEFTTRFRLPASSTRNRLVCTNFTGGTSMDVLRLNWRKLVLAVVVCVACACLAPAQDATLTNDQIKEFLINAKVVKSTSSKKGINRPFRLTLSDGTITHDASFESVNTRKLKMEFGDGTVEFNFVDSYKYNIAAYILAELLGVDNMMPVYVERKWNGKTGSLSWFLPVKMDAEEQRKEKILAPDSDAWNRQMYRIRVFDELVYDTDPNLTNVLIGEDWKIWRIDFSRAFRLSKDVRDSKNLVRCDRRLFENLKNLDAKELAEKTKRYLSSYEVDGVMARRDKIVSYFQKLIAEKGENNVLY